MFMAVSRNFLLAIKVSLTIAFIFVSLTFPPVGLALSGESSSISSSDQNLVEMKKMVLGSKPPDCVNKCLNCRPCKATLVTASPQKNKNKKKKDLTASSSSSLASSHEEDDSNYYPLVWKCGCGDKIFQP